MKKLRTAVIGVGHLGRFHAQKHVALTDKIDFRGVYDADPLRAKLVADELKVPALSTLEDVAGQVDAVSVASTTSSHFKVCEFFLNRGIHVLVEKPLTTNSFEGRQLCELAARKNVRLQVGHIERFNPAFVAARSKLKAPRFIECHRLAPYKPRGVDVNVVFDLMIHDLDIILHLVNSPPVSIDAIGTPILTADFDIANARIKFASGAVANVTSSRVSNQTQRKFRVFQESQYLSLDFGSGSINLMTRVSTSDAKEPVLETETWNLTKTDALLAETDAFVTAILENKPVLVSGEDGLKALRLAEHIANAMSGRGPVHAKDLDLSRDVSTTSSDDDESSTTPGGLQ